MKKSNDLETYFQNNNNRVIHKWLHYFEIYERHFGRFRNRDSVILEIGVSHGGSLQMWRNYFGSKARIIGVDINPACKEMEDEGFEIFIGSQSDRTFLRFLKNEVPSLDVLIDDGGHTMYQQIVTYEELFSHIAEDGVYLCEDLHTSYWPEYGGGLRKENSFIEYSKNLVDQLNAFHSRDQTVSPSVFTKTVRSMHYYDSILVIEKCQIDPPTHAQKGKIRINGL